MQAGWSQALDIQIPSLHAGSMKGAGWACRFLDTVYAAGRQSGTRAGMQNEEMNSMSWHDRWRRRFVTAAQLFCHV